MANRVHSETLARLVGVAPETDLTSFIDDAHVLVNETLLAAGFTADRLTLIEKYLAAHLYVLSYEKGGLTGQKVDDASESYSTAKGQVGLRANRFGQMVAGLDTSNLLTLSLEPSRKAQFRLV